MHTSAAMAGRHTGCHSFAFSSSFASSFPFAPPCPWGAVYHLLLFLHSQILLGEQPIGCLRHAAWDAALLAFPEHLLLNLQHCKEQLLVKYVIILPLYTFSQTGDHPQDVELLLLETLQHLVHGRLTISCVVVVLCPDFQSSVNWYSGQHVLPWQSAASSG